MFPPQSQTAKATAKATATASKKTKQKEAKQPRREGGVPPLAQERGRQRLPRPIAAPSGAGGGGGGRAQDFVTPQTCDSLTADAERAVGQVLPTQSQEQQRREVMLDLNSILSTMKPELEAHLYGSAGSGFGSRTSDLDVSIMKVRRTPRRILKFLTCSSRPILLADIPTR
jgi:DNA polymerase sigma